MPARHGEARNMVFHKNPYATDRFFSKRKEIMNKIIEPKHAADDILRARTRARPGLKVSSAMAERAANAWGIRAAQAASGPRAFPSGCEAICLTPNES